MCLRKVTAMANSKYLRWLKEDDVTTKIAQRFVDFCDEDIEIRANAENFDADIYCDAMKLIIERFEAKDEVRTGFSDSKGDEQ